jgi:hypothetical protein
MALKSLRRFFAMPIEGYEISNEPLMRVQIFLVVVKRVYTVDGEGPLSRDAQGWSIYCLGFRESM